MLITTVIYCIYGDQTNFDIFVRVQAWERKKSPWVSGIIYTFLHFTFVYFSKPDATRYGFQCFEIGLLNQIARMQTFLSFVWTLGMILCEVCGWLLRSRWFSRCFLNITLVRKVPDPQNKGLFLQAILLARVSLKNFGSNLKMKASLTQVLGSAITELSRSRPLNETLKTYFCIQFQVECRVSIYKVIIVLILRVLIIVRIKRE